MVPPFFCLLGGGFSNRDKRHLLQVGVVVASLGFALGGWNLRNRRPGRRSTAEIFSVYLIECGGVGQIVQVNIRAHHLIEIHSSLFEIVELISHGLTKLVSCGGSIDATVRSGNEPTLRGTVQGVAGE